MLNTEYTVSSLIKYIYDIFKFSLWEKFSSVGVQRPVALLYIFILGIVTYFILAFENSYTFKRNVCSNPFPFAGDMFVSYDEYANSSCWICKEL